MSSIGDNQVSENARIEKQTMESPSKVSCNDSITPSVVIENEGKEFACILCECLMSIETSISSQDSRYIARMLRRLYSLKRLFHVPTFLNFVDTILVHAKRPRGSVLMKLFAEMDLANIHTDVVMHTEGQLPTTSKNQENFILPEGMKDLTEAIEEVDLFLSTISLMIFLDRSLHNLAKQLADSLMSQFSVFTHGKKYEDHILAKVLFWVSRVYDLQGNLSCLRGQLMKIYRTAVLTSRSLTQIVVLNILLRSYVQDDLYDQAVQLFEKSTYPEDLRSSTQHARYLYYLARINAVRVNYSVAHSKIILALAKGPQKGSMIGRGFRITATKLFVIIQLLLGEIPERTVFISKDIRDALSPYAEIVQSVRSGDLVSFKKVLDKHQDLFTRDRNRILIERLHYNVIRTGLRKITASYYLISLEDISKILGMETANDILCIVAKAIADGVIDAKIDMTSKILQSKSKMESKTLDDPRKALHSRISFCLQIYNDALKAMQYPEQETDPSIEEAEARRKEHQEQLARAEREELDADDAGDLI